MNIFLGLIGVQEFFHLIFACANFFFVLRPRPPAPDKFSNDPSLRLRGSRLISLSVSCSFDRFLISCLRDSMALKKRFLSLIFLRSFLLRFLASLLSLLAVFFLAGDCVFWWKVCLAFLYYSLQYSCEIYTVRVYEACLLTVLRAYGDISPALLRELLLSFWSSLSRS